MKILKTMQQILDFNQNTFKTLKQFILRFKLKCFLYFRKSFLFYFYF